MIAQQQQQLVHGGGVLACHGRHEKAAALSLKHFLPPLASALSLHAVGSDLLVLVRAVGRRLQERHVD